MPFVTNMSDDEEQQKAPSQGAVPASGGAPMQVSPSSGVIGAGGSPSSKSTAPAAGGQFASLNQYLSANTANAAPLAGKVTQGIGQQYNDLQGQNQSTLSNINGQVTSGPSYANANDVIAKESANPTSFSNDAGNVASFQNLLNASYGGPTSAESTNDYTGQQTKINNAIAQGQSATQTEAGRENLLTGVENHPTAGVTALNSSILASNPDAFSSVTNAYQPFSNLLTGLQSGATDINKTIANNQAEANNAKTASTNALTSQISGLNTNVGNETTAAQQKLAAQNAQLKTDLAAGTPSAADLAALGISSDQWNSLSAAQKAAATGQTVLSNQGQFGAQSGTTNVDLTNFLSQNDPNALVNAANAATPEDYAKAQAFQTLMGNLNLGAPAMTINSSTAGQAGTAPTNLNSFDYQTALNTAQQAKSDEVAAAQAYVDALQGGADEEHAQLAAAQTAKKNQVMTAIPILGVNAGVLKGAAAAGNTYMDRITSTDPKQLAANIATFGTAPIAQAIGSGVAKAAQTVATIFCFHPDTLIAMEDGTLMPIHSIEVGDMTRGGKVLATTRAVGQDFYWYNGVIVTGKHAVKEEGVWVRVENSKLGSRFKYLTEVVCNLVTEKHRIYANGIEFADQNETDMYESLNMDESLAELNKNAKHVG